MTDDVFAYDLISPPDDVSRPLRDELHALALATGLMPRGQQRRLGKLATDTLDLLQQLLLLRRVLIVLMQAGGTEAVAFPFTEVEAAAHMQLRVRYDPALAGILQVSLPGDGFLPLDAMPPTPGEGWDSEGETPAQRLQTALEALRTAIVNGEGRDTLLALIDAQRRS